MYKDILRKLILSNLRKRRLKPDQIVDLKYTNYSHREKKPESPQRFAAGQTQVTPRQIRVMYHEISTNNENTPQESFRMLKNLVQTEMFLWNLCPGRLVKPELEKTFSLDLTLDQILGQMTPGDQLQAWSLPWLSDRCTYRYAWIN